MGTSSVYGGPSNSNPANNPLLPDDFEVEDENQDSDDEKEEDSQNNEDISWTDAKKYMSKLASGTHSNISKSISNYVKAYGGARNAAKSSYTGINTAVGLGNFVSNASSLGIEKVLTDNKIDYENKTPRELLNDITNLIAPVPITKDDSVARKALISTLAYLYDMLEDNDQDFDIITKDTLNLLIPKYIENYIFEKIINDLGSRIEFNSESSQQAFELEEDLKNYINAKVETSLKGKDFTTMDFGSDSINKEVEKLFNQCYTLLDGNE